MKNSEWDAWLQGWLKRHPLRTPPAELNGRFRQEVMSRIRAEQAPIRTLRWVLEPRRSFALGGVLAAVLALAVIGRPHAHAPSARQVKQGLAEVVTAKSAPSWSEFENDVEVLDLLEEEEAQAGKPDRVTDEELLEELKRIDDAEMALS